MTEWRGFIAESKSHMNHPDYWKKWQAALYLDDGNVDPNYPGWTIADKRSAKVKFWLSFPRVFSRFYWGEFRHWLRGCCR